MTVLLNIVSAYLAIGAMLAKFFARALPNRVNAIGIIAIMLLWPFGLMFALLFLFELPRF